jgi:hypothetical protein
MWVCPKCGEESEDNYDVCWNCQYQRQRVGRDADRAVIFGQDVAADDPGVVIQSSGVAGTAAPGARRRSEGTGTVVRDEAARVDHRPGEYLVLPFIGRIRRGIFSSENAKDVSNQLQTVINQQASHGWYFHSLEKVDIEVSPGCLASLFGAKSAVITFDQLVFRRKDS